ncbi:hypothetical protein AB0L54_30360 [Streptomyces sp. NPDC052196]|uniref:hypothetical protein n=1 Tax=Streptomyces sp. NPDC052196 TaxID=3156691 RepID=UPI00341BE696
MHSYDPSRQPYQSQIPAMRPSGDALGAHSPTPIYDALYSEYLRSFRALPGDRSGEEHLGFVRFGALGTGFVPVSHGSRTGHQSGHQTQHFPTTYAGNWHVHPAMNANGRQHAGQHQLPAALPPGPRRGL